MLSEQIEEYLEAIGKLEERGERITTSTLAKERQVSAPSATEMLGRLSDRGLVSHHPRGEVALTEEGRALARQVMRRHRLWERFLHDVLGFGWDRVHGEACKLEHATSPEMELTLARAVGVNSTCPHGHEIPGPEGDVCAEPTMPLLEMAPSQSGRVVRVREDDPALLCEMERLGLKPGVVIQMSNLRPESCETILRVDGESRTVPAEIASGISVSAESSPEIEDAIPLSDLEEGEVATVLRFTAGRNLMCRCLAMGFTPGTPLSVVQRSTGGPLIVQLRDSRVALGRGEAQKIHVLRKAAAGGLVHGAD